MSRPFLGALAEKAKRNETKIFFARYPASDRFIPDEDADLIIICYVSE
jgi:hypothetical protein